MMWNIFDRSDKAAAAELDAFVAAHPKGHFLQTTAWAAVKSHWDWQGILLQNGTRTVAAMLVLIRPLPFGLSLLYAPRGPVCDRNDPAVWQALMAALRQLAKQRHALLLHLDPDEPDSNRDLRSLLLRLRFTEKADDGFGNIQPQHVFRLDLTGRSREEIFGSFCAKTRYNIRLALRKGVTLREFSGAGSIPESVLTEFHALMQITGQRDRFTVRDRSYFEELLLALQSNALLHMAYSEDRPIAGAIEVFCGDKAWYLYGASANEYRNLMPNYLLQWHMIQRAMDRGCHIYDFRGVPGDPSPEAPLYGLYRFKKGFSGQYIRFTGLFTYLFHPVPGKLLLLAEQLRQSLRHRRKHKK